MIEFTWTGTVAESHLWVRELSRFAEVAPTIGELASVRATLEPHRLPYGVFPAGATDLDLLDEVLRARAPEAAVAEVLLEPRDDASVLFHGTYGFREVGQQSLPDYGRVSLLAKDLCSYPWVRDTYGEALPGETWLQSRLAAPAAAQPVQHRHTGT